MIRMDAKILSKKIICTRRTRLAAAAMRSSSAAFAQTTARQEEADPPLAQRAEALPKIDPRKRSWDKAAMHVWAHYHQNQCWPFSWERSFLGRRTAACAVCFGFWIFLLGR
jgi:hypothetical protein